MTRSRALLTLLALLLALTLPPADPAAGAPARQGTATPAPTPRPAPKPADVQALLAKMTPAERIGQLFLVTFQGNDAGPNSDIATLVRDYRVGGVVLLPANDNFRTTLVNGSPLTSTAPLTASRPISLSAPIQVARLTNALQSLAAQPPRPITTTAVITATAPITATGAITTTGPITPVVAITPTVQITPTSAITPTVIPLLVGLDWAGDDESFFSGAGGFIPLPSAMALGASWSPALAEQVGRTVGDELQAMGVNLLLGPTLDVLDTPRPGNRGDLDVRAFGGDPYWVGQLGQAFLRGVQDGGDSTVAAVAKHFPGQGGADRRPDDEVATVQKSLQQLRQIELAPFVAVTAGGDPGAPGAAAALMTSHIRYRGFQGNIRQQTPPISVAPELRDLMALKEFADWRTGGGVLVSDALGVPAIRRYYDAQLQRFPHRQVAQDAFLAGNDLLFLSRFALTDNWPDQFTAIKETIAFFQGKYASDRDFRVRVDAAVTRIITLKLRLSGGQLRPQPPTADLAGLEKRIGQDTALSQAVARASLTLIYPSRDELADRMPTAPLADENIVIFTDAREVRACPACDANPAIAPTALGEIMLRLYGPNATGKVTPSRVRSFTYADLGRLLSSPAGAGGEVERAITAARWLIFAQLDYNPEEHPESAALSAFLARRSDSLRDKRLVVMAFQAPYYLDTTEISKLTAYFGVYSKTGPFLETAVRALFREFTPAGASPVSITGIGYDLIRQLEPAPSQIIALGPIGPVLDAKGNVTGISVGSRVPLETGVILDRGGHPVPDGTLVEFRLRYPGEALDLAPRVETTIGGKARTTVVIERQGELWVTVTAGETKDSTRVVLRSGGDTPGSIATVVPTPTNAPSPTPTARPSATPTSEPTAVPTATATPVPTPAPQPRVTPPAFLFALLGVTLASGAALAARRRPRPGAGADETDGRILRAVAWAVIAGWVAYLLYALGWLPGATGLQAGGAHWAAGLVAFIGGLLSLLWSGRSR